MVGLQRVCKQFQKDIQTLIRNLSLGTNSKKFYKHYIQFSENYYHTENPKLALSEIIYKKKMMDYANRQ